MGKSGKSTISMAICNCYVSSPEGIILYSDCIVLIVFLGGVARPQVFHELWNEPTCDHMKSYDFTKGLWVLLAHVTGIYLKIEGCVNDCWVNVQQSSV